MNDANHDELQTMTRRLDEFEAQLSELCRDIAGELQRDPPLNAARFRGAQDAIKLVLNRFHAFLPEFNATMFRQAETIETSLGERAIVPTDWLVLNNRVGRARTMLNSWTRIRDLLNAQVPSVRRPLYADGNDRALRAQFAASDALFGHLHSILNPLDQAEAADALGCYKDIALPNSAFFAHAHAAYRLLLAQGRSERTRFLDVGCGGGLKVLSAGALFDECFGLEYDAGYADTAAALVDRAPATNCRIIEGDGLLFGEYHEFDVIYFYRPMKDAEKMAELERHIIASARPGTLLIAPYTMFAARVDDLDCTLVDGCIYIAGTDETEAEQLRLAAEFIGPDLPRSGPERSGIWRPVIEASRKRGYTF